MHQTLRRARLEGTDFHGWQLGSAWMTVGPHDRVKASNTHPGRLIWNLQTAGVRGDFECFKAAGATVVQEPYQPGEAPDGWIATFSDPHDDYLELISLM